MKNKFGILALLFYLGCSTRYSEDNLYSFNDKTIDYKNRIIRLYFYCNDSIIDSIDYNKIVIPSIGYKGPKYRSCEFLYKFQSKKIKDKEEEFLTKSFNYILNREKIKPQERNKIAKLYTKLNNNLIISSLDSLWELKHRIFMQRIDSLYKTNELDLCEAIVFNNVNYEITNNKSCIFFASIDFDIHLNPFSLTKYHRDYDRICISENEFGFAEVSVCNLSPLFRNFDE
jgi:hypothetical protein